jgi:hypothetical protein
MRKHFSGWYARTPKQLAVLWESAIFVPDTNILLHCLRHSAEVREELLRILEVLKESLWIPYQVGLEFHRNRLEVETTAAEVYDRLSKDYETIVGQAKDKLRQLRAHPTISVERELAAAEMFLGDFRSRMESAKAAHPTAELAVALDRITAIFDGRVGDKPSLDRLTAIRKEGEERYAKQIPPGFKDSKKNGEKLGDFIIWKDMIDKATTEKRPVILVSDDLKEDWWQVHRGRKLGPRPELLEEFQACSGQEFQMYELTQFLRFAAAQHREIRPEHVEQIEKSVLEDERAKRLGEKSSEQIEANARLFALENERDAIISTLAGVPSSRPAAREVPDKATLRARLIEIETEIAAIREELQPISTEK